MIRALIVMSLSACLIGGCGSDDADGGATGTDTSVVADDAGGSGAADGTEQGTDGASAAQDSLATGSSGGADGDGQELYDIEVGGEWVSGSGNGVSITDTSWGSASIVNYDNEGNWAVVSFPADDPFNGGLFGRFVWTEPTDGAFYHCPVLQGVATAEEAQNSTATADTTDPATEGCNGGPWFSLTSP